MDATDADVLCDIHQIVEIPHAAQELLSSERTPTSLMAQATIRLHHLPFAVHYLPSAVRHLVPSAVRYLLSAVHSSAIHHIPSAVRHPLSAVYCLPSIHFAFIQIPSTIFQVPATGNFKECFRKLRFSFQSLMPCSALGESIPVTFQRSMLPFCYQYPAQVPRPPSSSESASLSIEPKVSAQSFTQVAAQVYCHQVSTDVFF